MRTSRCTLAAAIFVALAATGIAAAAAPQTYVLRFHHKEGDKATYLFTSTSADKASGPGAPAGEVISSAQLTCTIEFRGASPGGDIVVQASIQGGSMTAKIGGQSKTVPVQDSLSSYVLGPRADLKESELLSGSPPQTSAAGAVFTADDAFLPPQLPDQPVKVGDRWQALGHLPAPTGEPADAREVKYDSRIVGQVAYAGRSCLKIKSSLRQSQRGTAEAPDGSGSAATTVQGTSEITWLFDPKAGLVMKADSDGTMRITRVVRTTGQGEQTFRISGTFHTHARMTEYNGKKVPAK